MPLRATLAAQPKQWLDDHPDQWPVFMEVFNRVRDDELALLRLTVAVKDPISPFMLRRFRFGQNTRAYLEWAHDKVKVRVVLIREAQ